MPDIGAPEIIIIAIVAILLFGAAKLPIFAKSLGESMRIFKKELRHSDDDKRAGELPPVSTSVQSTGSTAASATAAERTETH